MNIQPPRFVHTAYVPASGPAPVIPFDAELIATFPGGKVYGWGKLRTREEVTRDMSELLERAVAVPVLPPRVMEIFGVPVEGKTQTELARALFSQRPDIISMDNYTVDPELAGLFKEPGTLTRQQVLNNIVYGEPNPGPELTESATARHFESVREAMSWRGPSPSLGWIDEMARAERNQRMYDFLAHEFNFDTEESELLIELLLRPVRVGGRGFGKTARAEGLRIMNGRLDAMHIDEGFMESAKFYGMLDDPEGKRLCELIYRRRNPMREPVELTNDEGEKSQALRFDGGHSGNTAMCRFLAGTHHTHHAAKEYQREHIVVHSGDRKFPVEAGDWVITNGSWGFSVFTADEYDKLNERSD